MGLERRHDEAAFTENSRGPENFMRAPATKEGSFKHVKYLWRDEEGQRIIRRRSPGLSSKYLGKI